MKKCIFSLFLCCGFLLSFSVQATSHQPIVILTTFSKHSISHLVEQYQQHFPDTEIRVIFRRTRSALRLLDKPDAQNIDIIISSSPVMFSHLSSSKQLYAMSASSSTPAWLAPHILDISGEVAAFGYSGFGLMANKQYLESHQLPTPTSWEDLTKAIYYHHITMSTPSRSGTTNLMVENILQHYGWEQGWRLLMQIGGNIAFISSRSFGVSEAISKGFIGAAPVIDSYAINSQKVFPYIDFHYLPNSILMPAYIGIAQKSHAPEHALKFVNFLLSGTGQDLLEDSSMAKFSLHQPQLAQHTDVTLDKQQVHRRDPLISHLFDQTITNQLHELNSVWEAIHQLDAPPSQLTPDQKKQLEQAKQLATSVPVTANQAQSPAYLAMFHSAQAKQYRDPQVEAEIQQWKQQLTFNLQAANQILSQLSQE